MQLSPDQVVAILEVYKYLILFPLVVAEGVLVTIIAGFLASLGILNIYFVIVIAIVGDLTGDTVYYSLGRIGREKFIGKWGRFLGFGVARVMTIEKRYKNHAAKLLFVGKFAMGMEILSLLVAGAARVPYRKFMAYVFVPSIVKYGGLALVGYFFGSAYVTIWNILQDFWLAVPVFIALVVGLIFLYRYLMKKVVKGIE